MVDKENEFAEVLAECVLQWIKWFHKCGWHQWYKELWEKFIEHFKVWLDVITDIMKEEEIVLLSNLIKWANMGQRK